MRSRALVDVEVLDLLRDSPDLLAVADAISATQEPPRRRARLVRVSALAAVVAAAVLLALAAPWEGRGGGFVHRALAALGTGEVIHVVSVADVPGTTVLDLRTGVESPVRTETEIWFDSARGLERTTTRRGGVVTFDELQTPDGAWTQDGRVFTCAWIAAHPVEATKARVSCNASGDNGTTPRRIPEPRPVLDPALAGFVGGYRDALGSGRAVRDGSGVVGGRSVEWLRFAAGDEVERVAVDAQTLKPVLGQRLAGGKPVGTTAISTIETVAPQGVDFTRPQPAAPGADPDATSVTGQQPVSRAQAAAALGGRLLLAGDALDGLPLGTLTLQQIVTGYGAGSALPPAHSQGLELVYGGPVDWTSAADYVVVQESLQPEMLYRFFGPDRQPSPAAGTMRVSTSETSQPGAAHPTLWLGQLVEDGVYVTLQATSRTLLVDAARSLTEAR